MNRSQTSAHNEAIAAYSTVDGAELAVTHLVSLGYDEHDVGIAPRDFESVDDHGFRRLFARRARGGFALGLGTGVVVALARVLDAEALVHTVLPMIAAGALTGVIAGMGVAVLAYRRHRTAAFLEPEVIAPTRYEVMVNRDHDRARHGLARWWDPKAPPAGWQQPA